MAAGWAIAFNSPFMWAKQIASNFGGTRVGMVAHWPKGITAKGEIRQQFSHVIDIAPTILEAAGLPEPKVVNGTPQIPMEGKSLLASFSDAKAPARNTQYFEIAGNRAVYHDGWLAGVIHKAPWEAKPRRSLDADLWELYDVRNDFSCSTDLASKHPEKLKELQAVFLAEAKKILHFSQKVAKKAKGHEFSNAFQPNHRPNTIHLRYLCHLL
jgi:arylsulfatase